VLFYYAASQLVHQSTVRLSLFKGSWDTSRPIYVIPRKFLWAKCVLKDQYTSSTVML